MGLLLLWSCPLCGVFYRCSLWCLLFLLPAVCFYVTQFYHTWTRHFINSGKKKTSLMSNNVVQLKPLSCDSIDVLSFCFAMSSFFFRLLLRCLEGQTSNSRRSRVPSVCSTNSSWTSPPSSSSELIRFSCAVSMHKKKVSCNMLFNAISDHSVEIAINVSLMWGSEI